MIRLEGLVEPRILFRGEHVRQLIGALLARDLKGFQSLARFFCLRARGRLGVGFRQLHGGFGLLEQCVLLLKRGVRAQTLLSGHDCPLDIPFEREELDPLLVRTLGFLQCLGGVAGIFFDLLQTFDQPLIGHPNVSPVVVFCLLFGQEGAIRAALNH